MSTIKVRGLTYTYARATQPALRMVDLDVQSGELLCLVGPSGCGKTTLLKLVSGLVYPDSGSILFDGEDITSVPPERRKAVMVFQSHLLFPFMSVLDNIGFALRMQGVPADERRERSVQMLDGLHLRGFEDRRPESLSAGQRQRVALGRALVAEPTVLLLDEPLSSLDRHLREEMRQAIIELQRGSGVTTICVTHDQEEAVLLGDRIAMITDGQVVQAGSAEDFYERPASVAVARFFGNNNHIEGELNGTTVESAIATFQVETSGGVLWPEPGTVCIHIRPESIEMRPPCTGASNCIPGRVIHRVYVGTHVKYSVDVTGRLWQVVASPVAPEFNEGDEVSLHLPAQRIWLTRD
jgi:putative spermidine/putrescine transport system ATP-binding protein